MRKFIRAFFIIITLRFCHSAFVNSTFGNNASRLLAVVTLYRHGDRAPSQSFPNDPYFDEIYWPMGYGQLTNKGKQRLYELGQWLRSRYSSFLPEEYSPKDIYIRSTDADRCLMSAYVVLAGLYTPKNSQMWNQNLLWQPIPVHTTPTKKDEVLSMKRNCRKYAELYQNTLESKYFKKISATYGNFLEYVAKHSGWKLTDIKQIRTLQTVIDIYSNYNMSFIPSWSNSLDKKTLLYLAGLAHQTYTFTTPLKRLLTGPFWENLMTYFDNVINNAPATPKFLMLSAHDTTIVSLLNCMGAYDLLPPNFAASLIWEIRTSNDGKHYINLFYKKSSRTPDMLKIKECEIDCDYKNFKTILEPVTVASATWEEECTSTGKLGYTSSLMYCPVLLATCTLLNVRWWFHCFGRQK